jgi:hypothetical protein
MNINIAPDSLDKILLKEEIESSSEMILKVKKPDYLGQSKWEFHHGGRTIEAKINHLDWLNKFQNREIDIRPGDAIKGRVIQTTKYGFDNEVISSRYEIEKIIEVLSSPTQGDIFD